MAKNREKLVAAGSKLIEKLKKLGLSSTVLEASVAELKAQEDRISNQKKILMEARQGLKGKTEILGEEIKRAKALVKSQKAQEPKPQEASGVVPAEGGPKAPGTKPKK